MQLYRTNDCQFFWPEGFRDESINILATQGPDGATTSLVVTRAELDGQDIEAYALDQMKQYEANFKDYQFLGGRRPKIDGFEAREIEYKWKADEGVMHQWQLILDCDGRALVLTFSAKDEIDAEGRTAIASLVNSVRKS